MGVKHLMVSESKSRCGRTVVQGDGADCKNCARVKWVPTGKTYADVQAEQKHREGVLSAERVTNPEGRIGKVVAVYGDKFSATKVAVAWDAEADVTPHYAITSAKDHLISDLSPAEEAYESATQVTQVDPCAHCGRADSPRRDDIVKPFPHECASRAEIDQLIGLGETATPTGDDVLASLATIASTEPMSLPVDRPNGHAVIVHGYSTTTPKQESRLAKTRADIQAREAARAQAYEASMPVVGDTIYRESDGATGLVDDKTRHGRLVVVFRDGTERSVHWDVLVGEGFERITADDFAMLNPDVVRVVARLHYFSRVLVKDAHLMLDVLPEHVNAARKAGLITEYDEWLSVASKTIELITEADRVDAYLHFNPRPAVPPINSNIPHVFVPKDEGVEGGPSFCVAPCHGHKSMPCHVPATVRPVKLRQPVRTCLARRKRKATKRARARVGGGW